MGNGGPIGVEADDVGGVGGQSFQQFLLGEQDWRLRVFEHKGQALGWVRRVERHVGPARFENAQNADYHLQRAFDADAHRRLQLHAQHLQVMGNLVRPPIQFEIRECLLPGSDDNSAGIAFDLLLK